MLAVDASGQAVKLQTLRNYKQARKKGGDARAKKYVLLEAWIESEAPGYWMEDVHKSLRVRHIVNELYNRALKLPGEFSIESIPNKAFFRKRIVGHPDYPDYLSE